MPRKAASVNAPVAAPATDTPCAPASAPASAPAPAPAPAPPPSIASTTTADHNDAALKNINYKNMLLTGNYGMIKPDIVTNPNIDDILENEKNTNKSDPWNKLDKSAKIGKLKEFAVRHGNKENYTEQEITTLYQFLISALDQKKLMRAKDVIYDKVLGGITSVPCLIYHAGFKKFTLKRCEKRQSTLKSLAPTTSMSKKRKLAIEDTATAAAASATNPSPNS
jgi:hypothetical protein